MMTASLVPSPSSSSSPSKTMTDNTNDDINNPNANTNIPNKLGEILDDLCIRFILNLPDEEYTSFERLFFAIESAHWFYEDFYRENDFKLPKLGLKSFANKLLQRTTLILNHNENNNINKLINKFQQYKQEVPTYGAALLNHKMTKVIMVRGWGREGRWSFPKGKLAKRENELECAIREVYEEIGYDITKHIDENTYYINRLIGDKISRIYVIKNISQSFQFKTKTRKEISDIQWIPIHLLPLTKAECAFQFNGKNMNFAQNSVPPFVRRLRLYIERQQKMMGNHNNNINNYNNNMKNLSSPPSSHSPPAAASPSPPLPSRMAPSQVPFVPNSSSSPLLPASPIDPSKRATSYEEIQYNSNHNNHKSKRLKYLDASLTFQNSNDNNQNTSSSTTPIKSRESKAKQIKINNPKANLINPPNASIEEAAKNRTTFGLDSATLSADARLKYFQQYVVSIDKSKENRSSFDESWPTGYIKSSDFTPEERREAENAARLVQQKNASKNINPPSTKPSLQQVLHNQVNALTSSSPFLQKAIGRPISGNSINSNSNNNNNSKNIKNKSSLHKYKQQNQYPSSAQPEIVKEKQFGEFTTVIRELDAYDSRVTNTVKTNDNTENQKKANTKKKKKKKKEVDTKSNPSKQTFEDCLLDSIQRINTPIDSFVFDRESIMICLGAMDL